MIHVTYMTVYNQFQPVVIHIYRRQSSGFGRERAAELEHSVSLKVLRTYSPCMVS